MLEFIMLVGIPASGKSTYAKELEEKGYRIHSSDEIRKELTGDENTQVVNEKVFQVLHKRIKSDLEQGISCVYDATNISMKRRIAFLKEIKKYDSHKKCVLFMIPIEICKERNQNRKRKVPDYKFDKMLRQFQCPHFYEGWEQIDVFASNAEFSLPSMEELNYSQENSHHNLTLKEHLEKTELYILEHFENKEFTMDEIYRHSFVLFASKYHDIGKHFTKSFMNRKGEKTKEAHYYGHENYGAYVFGCHWFSLKGAKEYGSLYPVCLINWHMRPHTAWKQSEKSKERDKMLIGEEMYNDIMLLHKADLAAH